MNKEYVARYSPILADKLAVPTDQGLGKVVDEILRAVYKDKLSKDQHSKGESSISILDEAETQFDRKEASVSPSIVVVIDGFTVQEPALTKVYGRGIGFPGFEFDGVAPEEKGREIVEQLEQLEKRNIVACMGIDHLNRKYSGYGRLKLESQLVSTEQPIMRRFHGTVTFVR